MLLKALLSIGLLVAVTPAWAVLVEEVDFEFDFGGQAGIDLDEQVNGSTTQSVLISGQTVMLTLAATANVNLGAIPGELNQTGSSFGINADGGADDSDQIDGDGGVESIVFTLSSDVPVDVTFATIELEAFTGFFSGETDDEASLDFANSGVVSLVDDGGANELAINQAIDLGETVRLSFVAGNGFGLQTITFDVAIAAVPEPTTAFFGSLLATGLGLTIARRPQSRD